VDQNASRVLDKAECQKSYSIILSGMNTKQIKYDIYTAFNLSNHPKGCIVIHQGGKSYSLRYNDNPNGSPKSDSQQVCKTGKYSSAKYQNFRHCYLFYYSQTVL
jgi:hypothetical protein